MSSAPRKLRPAEIEEILKVIPKVNSISKSITEHVYSITVETTRRQLSEIMIKPSKIKKLSSIMYNQAHRSFIQSGENIGLVAAEAVSQPITQSTLDAFHHSGDKGGGANGLELFLELFNLSQNRKNSMCMIHTKNIYTFEQMLSLSRAFVSKPIVDFINRTSATIYGGGGIEIMKYDPNDEIVKKYHRAAIRMNNFANDGIIREISEFIEDGATFLRVTFKRWFLYQHRVTTHDISAVLEKYFSRFSVYILTLPTHVGIIDIFINPSSSTVKNTVIAKKCMGAKNSPDTIRNLYIQMELLPRLTSENTMVSSSLSEEALSLASEGIPIPLNSRNLAHTKSSFVTTKRVVDFIRSDLKLDDDTRTIWINEYIEAVSGIPRSNLVKVIKIATGCDVVSDEGDRMIVSVTREAAEQGLNLDVPNLFKTAISEAVDTGVTKYIEEVDASIKELTKKKCAKFEGCLNSLIKNLSMPPVPDIIKYGKYNFISAYTVISNTYFEDLIVHPVINPRFTIINNPHKVFSVLGLEASRSWIFRELYDLVLSTRKAINPRHIQVIVDEMTASGNLMPFTARGSRRKDHGAFSDASFEQALQAFLGAAVHGNKESVKSTSASVLIGNNAVFGTGIFYLASSTKTEDPIAVQGDRDETSTAPVDFMSDTNEPGPKLNFEERRIEGVDELEPINASSVPTEINFESLVSVSDMADFSKIDISELERRFVPS